MGISQDELSDCSRILANFYLQDYDWKIKEVCKRFKCEYLRYADDQIIFCRNKLDAKKIITVISRELKKIGLNLNTKKIEYFNAKEFNEHWSFDIFSLIGNDFYTDYELNKAISIYLRRLKTGIKFKEESILKRIIATDSKRINKKHMPAIEGKIFSEEFIMNIQYFQLVKLKRFLSRDSMNRLTSALEKRINLYTHNNFHYNLLKFYRNEYPTKQSLIKKIENRIINLKKIKDF